MKYGRKEPSVNMCFPPLAWQTYDVEFKSGPADPKTNKQTARVTVLHNGVKIHDNLEFPSGQGPLHLQNHEYDVVVSNYNGKPWNKQVNDGLQEGLKAGKLGLVIVHAANNAFSGWKEYDLMIGIGWRGATYGLRLKVDDSGKQIKVPAGEDLGSGHRSGGNFAIVVRDPDHPVTKGMPREWMHAQDELYDNMRGPIENVHLLATAYSNGTKTHEPMIWTGISGRDFAEETTGSPKFPGNPACPFAHVPHRRRQDR